MKFIAFYKKQDIKTKLFILLFTLIFVVSVISLAAMNISFSLYDDILLNESAEVTALYSATIEHEIKNIELLTYKILSDPKIQSGLKTINTFKSSYEKYNALESVKERLMAQAQTERYITSISLITLDLEEHASGANVIYLEETLKNELIESSKSKEGAIIWRSVFPNEKTIIAAREIRSTEDMSTAAILIVRIDMEKLVLLSSNVSPKYHSNLIIFSGQKPIFATGKESDFTELYSALSKGKAYQVNNIGGKKYLISTFESVYTQWQYINLLSYDNILQRTVFMRLALVLLFAVVFAICIYVGMKFAKGITSPIIALSKKMKKVEKGDFTLEDEALTMEENADEVQHLKQDFSIMINKINILIKENYVKQILIKETELKALQAQINPHFLYNTLESINWLAKMNQQHQISAMVKALGNLLRKSISNNDVLITVADEIQLLGDYITIQKVRFEERLDFKLEVGENLMEIPMLKFTLQPIVENSIQYGLENMIQPCKIVLRFIEQLDYLEIHVIDNGPGMSEEFLEKLSLGTIIPKGTGVGLKNINERIKITFGEEYGLSYQSSLNAGMTVIIKIPNGME